jgi:hypothetical protein
LPQNIDLVELEIIFFQEFLIGFTALFISGYFQTKQVFMIPTVKSFSTCQVENEKRNETSC